VFVHDVLDNGLEVSVLSDPRLELVATQVWYHVGSSHEDDGSRGLAHLFEHLMFGPTDKHEKDAVFRFHTRNGGSNGARTSLDETVYESEVAPPLHLEVLSLEAARMGGLRLTQAELENEQRIVSEELRLRTENNPAKRVIAVAQKAVLGEHPYALSPGGTKEDIAATTLGACSAFYDRYYRPANAHVVVAGPIDPLPTLEAVRERFGSLHAGEVDRPEVPPLLGRSFPPEVVLAEDIPPAEIAVAFYPVPGANHPDSDALTVLSSMLEGQTNPFREDIVRERGKALEAGVVSVLPRSGGFFAFYAAQLPYRRKSTAFRQLDRSMTATRDGLTEQRLQAASRRLLLSEHVSRFYAPSAASSLGRARWHRGEAADAFQRTERLLAVTLEDVHRVWRTYIENVEPVRLYFKPEKVPIVIRLFGWLYPLVS
jgi:zinc protease